VPVRKLNIPEAGHVNVLAGATDAFLMTINPCCPGLALIAVKTELADNVYVPFMNVLKSQVAAAANGITTGVRELQSTSVVTIK
jgi:hypothetical protein